MEVIFQDFIKPHRIGFVEIARLWASQAAIIKRKGGYMTENRHIEDKTCGCVFCNSKCPACGSIHVDVKFKIAFEYSNDEKNRISLSQDLGSIEVQCEDCDEWIVSDEFEDNDDLDNLHNALKDTMGIGHEVEITIDEEGKVACQSSWVEGKIIPKSEIEGGHDE